MRYLVVPLILSFWACQQSTQPITNNADAKSIEQTINTYFDGWLTGDSLKVGSAMHSTCHLKFFPRGEFGMRTRNQYLSNFKPRPKLEGAEGRIITLDITGPIASAKCELETKERLFTDYFNMMKIDDRWYIVDKISANVAKE